MIVNKRTKTGFTLIELLVVVLIIGILAAVALPQYQKAVLKSHYVQLQTLVEALGKAETVYRLANGAWTRKLDELDVALPGDFTLSSSKTSATSGKVKIDTWESADHTVMAIMGNYDYRIIYLWSPSSHQCRAKEGDAVAISICEGMGGTYMNVYNGYKSYLMP